MTLVLSTKVTWQGSKREALHSAIVDCQEWRSHTGNMRGKSNPWEMARLPSEWVPSFRRAEYAIYSYSTPIAWFGGLGIETVWTVPDEKYSVTTTQHQGVVRVALARAGKHYVESVH